MFSFPFCQIFQILRIFFNFCLNYYSVFSSIIFSPVYSFLFVLLFLFSPFSEMSRSFPQSFVSFTFSPRSFQKVVFIKVLLPLLERPFLFVYVFRPKNELRTNFTKRRPGMFTIVCYRPRRYVLHDLLKYLYAWMWKDDEWGFEIMDSRFSLSHMFYSYFRDKAYLTEPVIKMTKERFERVRMTEEVTTTSK